MNTILLVEKAREQIDRMILIIDPAYADENGMVDGYYDMEKLLFRLRKAMNYLDKFIEAEEALEDNDEEEDDLD